MSDVVIKRSPEINQFDSAKYNGNPKTFHLEDKNDTEQDLILLYMYILPKFQGHGIKVGMTKCKMDETFWHAIKSRISNQKHELALTDEQYPKYGLEREVIYWGVCMDANNESFKDYKVHDQIMAMKIGLSEKEQEWFQNVPADELVEAFEICRNDDSNNEIYTPRDEQQECVDSLKDYFESHKTGGRFLLNCKMRYGKSYTTYKYCEEAGLDKILILTFIPAVESSWKEDLTHIKKHYDYFTDDNLRKESFILNFHSEPYVVFLSLQNYLGKDKDTQETKNKIKQLQDIQWDLVILDEYHFGAWNEKTQGTLESQEDLQNEYQTELKKTKDIISRFKINTKQTICLSGTPFKAIAKGEFTKENTFTYSYFDEQRNKYPKSEVGDFSVVNKDYAHFPDMRIFGYNMSRLFSNMTASVFSGDTLYGKKYFSLNKFFETRKDSNPNQPCVFVYEEEIKKWLNIIKGQSTFGDKFPYSNPDMLINNKHTLWLLPRVNAVHAMAKLLEEDDYFKKYQIINLSKDGVGAGVDAYDYLKDQITAANNTNKLGSIALTVNKLTIGVTVKEWFSVFVLKDLASPEQYFQSIFRIQTPYKEKDEIKKKYGFVYDFNIDRAAALLLRYAEQSEEKSVTKLEIAKLIVKYLPIFVNGDMTQPIGTDVFYELAEFGDTTGVPLSRKITDTSKTTRMLDDEVIAAMLNDDQVSDIIKRVFAHAKFSKPKGQTVPPKPDNTGFKSKEGIAGRNCGYEKGESDYEKYIDYDNNEIQEQFEKAIADYIKELCPTGMDQEHTIWWANGFTRGYESGVNAPVKKLNCGYDDGIKFVDEIKKRFGKNIIWKEETRKSITDFIHKHLNNINNIPQEYRGALYKRWYCDSFKRAAKNELAPKVPYEKGKSVEDADNVMKHILARLFEFLYISVYRETTFQEIFNNADPNIFLEAVGITKKDFEVLNKYHIFQENVLNNYIHQFFVNESLGSKLNLEDEEIKRQYRNSFDWFGFGLNNEDVQESTTNNTLNVYNNVVYNYLENDEDENNKPAEIEKRYYLAYGSNLNNAQMSNRCPNSVRVGVAKIKDYRLMFKGSYSGNYLTIEEAAGYTVPVGVFLVDANDELRLDRYEGFPNYYYKKQMKVELHGDKGDSQLIDAFVYIMHEDRELGVPTDNYVAAVKKGYLEFDFDISFIDEAINYSSSHHDDIFKDNKINNNNSNDKLVAIKKVLIDNSKGLTIGQISNKTGISKQEISTIINNNKDSFKKEGLFKWKAN